MENIIELYAKKLKEEVGTALNYDECFDLIEEAINEALKQRQSLPIGNVIDPFCDICKSGLKDYPDINRRTCSCGALGYNVTK